MTWSHIFFLNGNEQLVLILTKEWKAMVTSWTSQDDVTLWTFATAADFVRLYCTTRCTECFTCPISLASAWKTLLSRNAEHNEEHGLGDLGSNPRAATYQPCELGQVTTSLCVWISLLIWKDNGSHLIGSLRRLKEIKYVKCWEWCLARSDIQLVIMTMKH